MSSAAYEPVATTEGETLPPPTRPRKYRVIAIALLVSFLGVVASYKSGIWSLPSAQVTSQPPTPSPSLTTPSTSDTEEKNNKTGTETSTTMPRGKYSVG